MTAFVSAPQSGGVPRVLLALRDWPELGDLVRSLLTLRMLPVVAVNLRHAMSLLNAVRLDMLVLDGGMLAAGGDPAAWRALADKVTVLGPAPSVLPADADVVDGEVSSVELSLMVRDTLSAAHGVLRRGALEIDLRTREVRWMCRRLDISAIQLRLLIVLAEADGAVVSKDALAWRLFGNCSTNDERVETHVRRIRRQLVAIGCTSRILANVRGEGYRLMAADFSG
ncbi:MAG TPA: winged helix-turn-helix domain-containing protein [Micromonosporaceae bacterium]